MKTVFALGLVVGGLMAPLSQAWAQSEAVSNPAAAGALIYNTFNADPNNLYNCCTGYPISGSGRGRQFSAVAFPFVPTVTTTLSAIRVAIGLRQSPNSFTLSLHKDVNGLPGRALVRLPLATTYQFTACCSFEEVAAGGFSVTAGQTYWVSASPGAKSSVSTAAWSYNNVGATGNYAVNNGAGWVLQTGVPSAVQIVGN